MIEAVFTWLYFLKVLLVLGLLYAIGYLFGTRLLSYLNHKVFWHEVANTLRKLTPLFLPVAIFYLIVIFIGIHPVFHGSFLLVLGIVLLPQIRCFLDGMALRSNPATSLGAHIVFDQLEGEIKAFLPLGLLITTTKGEHFVNYSNLQKGGFAIHSQQDGLVRQTLYLRKNDKTSQQLLDLLFLNPLVDTKHLPTIREYDEDIWQVQCTLERGASLVDLQLYLKQAGIPVAEIKETYGDS